MHDRKRRRTASWSLLLNNHKNRGEEMARPQETGFREAQCLWRRGGRAAVALFFGLMAAGWMGDRAEADTLVAIDQGGRLYDNWIKELDEYPPEQMHPAYPQTGTKAISISESWRCVTCHGWDYKGQDALGIKGIDGQAGAGKDAIIAILKDKIHGYDEMLSDASLSDLASFVSEGQIPMDDFIDPATGKAKGNPDNQDILFSTVCVTCHGGSGDKLLKSVPLGRTARQNPQATLHKVTNGHPGARMPALRALGLESLGELVALLQGLPQEIIQASIVRGGRLYDNWYKETGALPPSQPHKAYPADRLPEGARQARMIPVTWRCKECHGWDYKGRDGHYGGDHVRATGIVGVRAMVGKDPMEIMEILQDKTHDYGHLLEARDYLDLANFLSKGQVDTDAYIDPETAKVDGNPENGTNLYGTICGTCHGQDGKAISTMPPLGLVVSKAPWSALHKTLNGHPDEAMPPMRVLEMQQIKDIIAYAQSLPQ